MVIADTTVFLSVLSMKNEVIYFDYGLVSSGISVFYWASSISENSPYNAWGMGFNSSIMNNVIYADLRSIGISIRPVCE